MDMSIEMLLIIILAGYFMVGISQILTALQMKREARRIRFPRKDFFVSVIIPIKEVSRKTRQHLESVCRQDYPHFEVLFVAERIENPAYRIAKILALRYQNTKVILSGPHDPNKTIGKCHNLIYGAKNAKGDVLLFGDSDVTYSNDWIKKMTSPLKENIEGRCIEAVTAPFFIEPEGFLGKFIAQSISLVTFTASFTRQNQRFPPFASGASIAVSRDVFDEMGIVEIWKSSFNDDLVFADTLINHGHPIYNQLAHLNHPNEAFLDLRQTKEKLIRWVVTISTFSHWNLRKEVPIMVAKNLQFQFSLILGLTLLFFGFPWLFALSLVAAGYVYVVVYRWFVGEIVEERDMFPYYLLAPISVTAMILFFVLVRPFYRSFSWEGEAYKVKGSHSI